VWEVKGISCAAGTTGVGALRMGRAFIGVELKRANFLGAVHFLSDTIVACAEKHVGSDGLKEPYPKKKVTNVK
jgi:hypothetical protein